MMDSFPGGAKGLGTFFLVFSIACLFISMSSAGVDADTTGDGFSLGYKTTINIAPTNTIQHRLTRTENVYDNDNTAIGTRTVEYPGASTYIYDVSAENYQKHTNKQLSKLQVKFKVSPNPLTRIIWQENYQVFNENYFYNGDNITTSEFDNLKQELSSIPVVMYRGSVSNHFRTLWNPNKKWKSLNPKNITMNIFLKDGFASGKLGSHSISWSVSSETDWWDASSPSENDVRTTIHDGSLELSGENAALWMPMDDDTDTTVHDLTSLGNDGTMNGGLNSDNYVPGPSGHGTALSFDGTDDYVKIPNSSNLQNTFDDGDFTIGFWMKHSPVSARTAIIHKLETTDKWWRIMFNSDGTIVGSFDDTSTKITLETSSSLDDDSWHHIVYRRTSGTGYEVFVDSESEKTAGNNGDISDTDAVFIGKPYDQDYFNGKMDEVRIYDRALSENEIERIYNRTKPSDFDPPENSIKVGTWASTIWDSGATSAQQIENIEYHDSFTETTIKENLSASWVENFESGDLGDFVADDADFGATNTYSYNGSYSAGLTDNSVNQLVAHSVPTYLSGGKQIDKFQFYWRENSSSRGGGISLVDSSGNEVLGVATDNPEWDVKDSSGWSQFYDPGDYLDWTRFTVTFDWGAGTYILDAEDMADGDTASTSGDLINATNVENILIKNQNQELWVSADDMYMWFDNIAVLNFDTYTKPLVENEDVWWNVEATDTSENTGWFQDPNNDNLISQSELPNNISGENFQLSIKLETDDTTRSPSVQDYTLNVNAPPNTPENLGPTGTIENRKPNFVWGYSDNDGDTENAYEIEVDNDDDWTNSNIHSENYDVNDNVESRAIHLSGLSDDTRYYYRIRAHDNIAWGSWASDNFYLDISLVPSIDAPSDGEDITVNTGYDLKSSVSYTGLENLSYEWDVGPDILTGPNPTYTWGSTGDYTIVLTVSEENTVTATDSVTINVIERPGGGGGEGGGTSPPENLTYEVLKVAGISVRLWMILAVITAYAWLKNEKPLLIAGFAAFVILGLVG